jgi:hypothetical protein
MQQIDNALEMISEAQQFDTNRQYPQAYDKYIAALNILLDEMKRNIMSQPMKELIMQQASEIMDRAEKIKSLTNNHTVTSQIPREKVTTRIQQSACLSFEPHLMRKDVCRNCFEIQSKHVKVLQKVESDQIGVTLPKTNGHTLPKPPPLLPSKQQSIEVSQLKEQLRQFTIHNCRSFASDLNHKLKSDIETQTLLNQRQIEVRNNELMLDSQIPRIKQEMKVLQVRYDGLINWESQTTNQTCNVDDIVAPDNERSRIILELQAEDSAISDLMFVLDQTMDNRKMNATDYLTVSIINTTIIIHSQQSKH